MNKIDLFQNQNKVDEASFFNSISLKGDYNVFSDKSNEALIDAFLTACSLNPGAHVLDIGCGSGILSHLIQMHGFKVVGVDLSFKMIALSKKSRINLSLWNADVEALPFQTESLDSVFASGLLHHLPDPSRCIKEIYRILKPGGTFFAFDPNRKNPFMWLYRDKASPFYSSVGVSPNERPIIASELAELFKKEGFRVKSDYISLSYRYIASNYMRFFLPLYNKLEKILFMPSFLKYFRAIVLTSGVKKSVR